MENYWEKYMEGWFGRDLIGFHNEVCEHKYIETRGKKLHIEQYILDKDNPTLVFSHGIAGYGRVLLPFIKSLVDRGVNVICPDLTGYGYNEHRKGDFTWSEHVNDLIDVLSWSRQNLNGPLHIGGASMGGPLAYEAACRSDHVDGLICWCLWDMSDSEFLKNETALGSIALRFLPFMKLIGRAFGSLRIKTTMAVSYDTLTDDPLFNEMVKRDPQAGTLISLRGAMSLICENKPAVPYEKFHKPLLVFQPMADTMTPAHYSEKAFKRIGSSVKRYIKVDKCPHFPLDQKIYEEWGSGVLEFLQSESMK